MASRNSHNDGNAYSFLSIYSEIWKIDKPSFTPPIYPRVEVAFSFQKKISKGLKYKMKKYF